MLKSDVLTEVQQRLGDTTTAFQTILSPIFDEVVRELAAYDAIGTLRKTHTFRWVATQMNYDTRGVTGLNGSTISAPTGNDYPIDILKIFVPGWSSRDGILQRLKIDHFTRLRMDYTNTDGSLIVEQPIAWTIYPNQTQIQFAPAPDNYSTGFDVECWFLAPPTTLALSDNIVEIRLEHIPFLVAGCVAYGASFQDETVIDQKTARQQFELGIIRMKAQNTREKGRAYRTNYRDF